ncbi:MAG TPA: RNA 2',3'-cyclic phosphodiesterase [Chloroflexota bacterium]|nr:RNA 2',3'-cyclic phosphodiesterase [Chloroflexota bacterium]
MVGATIRAFLAVEVTEEVRQEMRAVQDQFRQARPHVKWVEPELAHLTLKFLGLLDERQLTNVSRVCQETAARHLPFYLAFQGLGAFPNIRNVRMLWMGLGQGEGEMAALAGDVQAAVEALGFPAEDRAFQPHLTLGRLKEPLNRVQMLYFNQLVEGYAAYPFGFMPVTAFQLVKSVLEPSGPVYSVLETYALTSQELPAPAEESALTAAAEPTEAGDVPDELTAGLEEEPG